MSYLLSMESLNKPHNQRQNSIATVLKKGDIGYNF